MSPLLFLCVAYSLPVGPACPTFWLADEDVLVSGIIVPETQFCGRQTSRSGPAFAEERAPFDGAAHSAGLCPHPFAPLPKGEG